MKKILREKYTDRIIGLLGKGEVVVLTGHRRAGKQNPREDGGTDSADVSTS